MKWSFRLFTFAGTEVRVHVTFLLLLLFVASQSFLSGQGLPAALESTFFITAMFACVVLHEFGHVTAARGYGIRTPDITLLEMTAGYAGIASGGRRVTQVVRVTNEISLSSCSAEIPPPTIRRTRFSVKDGAPSNRVPL